MKCMKCNHSLTEKGYCSQCGFNISHLIKSKNTAGWYYNQGLEKAKNRELSDAAALLEIALSFDKEHIDARNLLGLIYHEMGQIARAMHQWVISINIDFEDNIAVRYLQEYQEDERAMQKVDRGVNLYNQALYSARLGKEGMALLKIEECCFVAPNFIEAHLLRALLYMKKQDWEQAKKALKDVLKIDYHNQTAFRYLREIPDYDEDKNQKELLELISPEAKKPEKGEEQPKKEAIVPEREEKEVIVEKEKKQEKPAKNNTYLKVIGGLVAGIAMGVILMWGMLVPSKNQSFAQQMDYVKNQISNKNTPTTEKPKTTEQAKEEDAKKISKKLAEYTGDGETRGIMDYMVLAMEYYKEGDAVKAAKALVKVDEKDLESDTSKDRYDEIKKSTFGEASTQLYNTGKESYDNQDYEAAIKDLKYAYTIDDSNVEAYYYLGLSYQASGDTEKAKKVFEKINTKFKGSDREHDAKDRLTEMGY